jgi:hypothetical protein
MKLQPAYHHIRKNMEAYIWLMVLVYLIVTPVKPETHFTVCPLSLAGFDYCPGCGLGRSIGLLLHGELIQSLQMHPLAILAVLLIANRIVVLFWQTPANQNKYFQS